VTSPPARHIRRSTEEGDHRPPRRLAQDLRRRDRRMPEAEAGHRVLRKLRRKSGHRAVVDPQGDPQLLGPVLYKTLRGHNVGIPL
jgi:hypothetical protein